MEEETVCVYTCMELGQINDWITKHLDQLSVDKEQDKFKKQVQRES